MQRAGCLARLILPLLLCGLGVAAVVALLNPWALHRGDRWTPLLTWRGFGTFGGKSGPAYPIFLSLYPPSNQSRLRLDGRRATGGLQGQGCLCTSSLQYLELTGDVYGR